MKPVRIYLKDFMLHRQSEIDCEQFNTALIVGKKLSNERISNGVGKSTIFNAIEYALFNKSHATTLDGIVREGKRKAIVEFDFDLKGNRYRIYRHRTSSGTGDLRLYQYIDGIWESISGRTPSATEQMLQELIKIKHKSFESSVLFRQAHLTGLSTKDPKERKELLKEPLDLAPYTKLEDLAASKAKPVRKQIDTIEKAISYLGKPEEDIKAASEKISSLSLDIIEKTKLAESYTKSLELKQQNIDELKASLKGKDSDVHEKIEAHNNSIRNIQKKIKATNDAIVVSTSLIDNKTNEIDKLIQILDKYNEQLLALQAKKFNDINDLTLSLTSIKTKEAEGRCVISEIKAELKLAQKRVPDTDFCVECLQPITAEHRLAKQEEIAKEITAKIDELAKFEEKFARLILKKESLEKEIEAIRSHTREVQSLERNIEQANNEINWRRDSIKNETLSLNKDRQEIETLSEQLKDTIASFEMLKQVAKENNIEAINSQITSLQDEVRMYSKSIKSVNDEITDLKVQEGALKAKIEISEANKLKLVNEKSKLDALKSKLHIYQLVQNAFSSKGIPTFIIHNILDELQFESNKALQELRPELEIRLDADLNIEYRRGGRVREYGMLSHGQHVYIAMAFKLGLAKVIQRKIGIDINMIQLDEVDSPLDDEGLDALVDIVKKWQKDHKIFIVTHNKYLKDKFSHIILVEEGEDGSEARLVSNW